MKIKVLPNVARVLSFASAVFLGAISLGLIASGGVQAYTQKELAQATGQLSACQAACGGELSSCIGGCPILFGRRCVNSCNVGYSNCGTDCWANSILNDPDAAFYDTGTITPNGHISLSGPLTCTEGGKAIIGVTLTQAGTGAAAEGDVKVQCKADTTAFTVKLKLIGHDEFLPLGAAKACGRVQVYRQGESVDAFQWCREITLLPEGVELQDDE